MGLSLGAFKKNTLPLNQAKSRGSQNRHTRQKWDPLKQRAKRFDCDSSELWKRRQAEVTLAHLESLLLEKLANAEGDILDAPGTSNRRKPLDSLPFAERKMGMAQNCRTRVTQVLIIVSIYPGAVWVHLIEPQPFAERKICNCLFPCWF